MINGMIELLNEIKNYIASDQTVSYIETVAVRKYEKRKLPDFENYAVIISPDKESERLIANRTRMKTLSVDIVVIVRNFDDDNALMGTGNERGILQMVRDVKEVMRNFGESNKDELIILYDEMDNDIDYSFHKFPEREEFFYEVILTYKVRLKEEIF